MSEQINATENLNGAKPLSLNAGKASPGRYVMLGGERYELRYTMYAYERLDVECGRNVFVENGFSFGAENAKPSDYTQLLWAGMITDRPEITRLDVAKMCTPADIAKALPVITAAIEASLPAEIKKNRKKVEAPTA